MPIRCILFLLLSSTCAAQITDDQLPGSEPMVYKTVGDVHLKMWVYSPREHDPEKDSRPAIVFFFGGGWRAGSPTQFESHCRYLASRGMVAATADYRVANRHGVKAVDCVEDAKSAVRWLRQNAMTLGIDPNRIAAGGGSAGGHTACCTGVIQKFDAKTEDASISSVPNALALFNPAVQLAELEDFGAAGIAEDKLKDIATRTGVPPEQISPIHHVRSGLPPTIIFHGIADTTVPYATVAEFTKRSLAAANRCDLHGFADAPHGFFNLFNLRKNTPPERRDRGVQWHDRTLLKLDSFLADLGWLTGDATIRIVDNDNVALRGHVKNSFVRFAKEQKGHVAFIGGSITEMNGYRPRVADWLQQRFPNTTFTFTNAGISSTCSNTGAFRLQRDILDHGPVDLLFVEFAVNDDQDAMHSAEGCVRGMEGIIRHVRRHNPNADVVMTHFVNPGMLETLASEKDILSASSHEDVARHYAVSSVSLAKEVAARIAASELTWKDFGGTHPGPIGNQLAADLAVSILEAGWKGLDPNTTTIEPHDMPDTPLLKSSFASGKLLPLDAAELDAGWQVSEPDWSTIDGSKRSRYLGIPLIHTTTSGATLKLKFNGTAVGAFLVAGPDAGQLEFQIDDGDWQSVELFHRYSKGLHYPRTVMFSSDLALGAHEINIRLGETHHPDSKGTAARILHLVVNE